MQPDGEGNLFSDVLGARLAIEESGVRLFDRQTGSPWLSPSERAVAERARAEAEAARADAAEQRIAELERRLRERKRPARIWQAGGRRTSHSRSRLPRGLRELCRPDWYTRSTFAQSRLVQVALFRHQYGV